MTRYIRVCMHIVYILTNFKIVGQSNCRTMERSDYPTVGLTHCHAIKLSDNQNVGQSRSQTIQLSDEHTVRQSNCRTIELSDNRNFGQSKFRTIELSCHYFVLTLVVQEHRWTSILLVPVMKPMQYDHYPPRPNRLKVSP